MPYPEEMVAPMRAEAVTAGAAELRTPDDVRAAFADSKGTSLFFINSVCGCSAACARPGLSLALRGAKRPDRTWTAFAGNDTDAVAAIRARIVGFPPSSPSIALFKDGELVTMLERHDIQGISAEELAVRLSGAFERHC